MAIIIILIIPYSINITNNKFLKNFIFFIKILAIIIKVWYITIVRQGHGGLAQLGEHLPYKQTVIGSSPIAPTNIVTRTARSVQCE